MLKKSISIILCVMMIILLLTIVPFSANAESENKTGDCVWAIDNDGTLTISGIGKMGDYEYNYTYCTSPWYNSKELIKKVRIENGVTNIGDYAFFDCTNLRSVELSSSVMSIGCESFSNCSSLNEIVIPNSVNNIGNNAFYNCKSLTEFDVPNSIKVISYGMFRDCANLESVSLPESITTIDGDAFINCYNLKNITIPEGVTMIAGGAFMSCTSLSKITIPGSVEEIGYNAFLGTAYYNNQNNWDKDGVLYIGRFLVEAKKTISGYYTIAPNTISVSLYAFSGCASLVGVSIPNSITRISEYAFMGCEALKSITIPNSVLEIGYRAFYNCSNLTKVILSDNIIYIGHYAFEGTGFYNNESNWRNGALYIGCHLISASSSIMGDYTIDDKTVDIACAAFEYCSQLKSITIPENVKSIGGNAFSFCKNLKNVTIPIGVTSIDGAVFKGCSSLLNVDVPVTVNSIGESAFEKCTSLNNITIPKTTKNIYQKAFNECNALSDVYYGGGKIDWKRISIGKNNDCLLNATIHFSESAEITQIDTCLQNTSNRYDNDLAIISAELSNATYNGDRDSAVRKYLNDLGFKNENIVSNNFGGSLAFTIGTKEYLGDDTDDNTDIIVIAAQGSTNIYELYNDSFSIADQSYKGYSVYGIVNDFRNSIAEKLEEVIDKNKNYKILLTGHSLGGAGVNLLGAELTDQYGQNNVFCYTFGAINSIVNNHPISYGYENIHNIYNDLDTFSPYQYGGVMKNGAGKKYGKFGHLDVFVKENRAESDKHKDPIVQCADHINHDMDKYLKSVKDGLVENSLLRNCDNGAARYTVIACPVDIEVYSENKLVGKVTNNTIDETVTNIDILVTDDIKVVIFPDNKQYDIKISANDNGKMSFYTQDNKDFLQQKIISDASLETGKLFSSTIGGSIDTEDIALYVVDKNNNCFSEVLDSGTEISSITINKNEMELSVGESTEFTIVSKDDYSWRSADETIATVENGIVTAISAGVTKIIAETVNGARAVCRINVTEKDTKDTETVESTTEQPTETTAVKPTEPTEEITTQPVTDFTEPVTEATDPITDKPTEATESTSELTTPDFEYQVVNNEAVITKYSGSDTEVIIPSEIDGYKVTTIGSNAFVLCKSLEKVIILEGITKIESRAFDECEKLTSVETPQSLRYIERDSFRQTPCFISKNNAWYINDILMQYSDSAVKYTVEDGTRIIANRAFESQYAFSEITIPESVIFIGDKAFEDTSIRVIYGHSDSYAEKYAKEQNIKFVSLDIIPTEPNTNTTESTEPTTSTETPTETLPAYDEALTLQVGETKTISLTKSSDWTATVRTDNEAVVKASIGQYSMVTFGGFVSKAQGIDITGLSAGTAYVYVGGYSNKEYKIFVTVVENPTEQTNPTEASTDKPTEPQTDNPTEPTTDKPTEPVVTQPSTEAPTQSATATPKTTVKKSNPIKVSVKKKTVKLKKLKKKAQKVKAITVKNAQGKVTYKLVKKGITKKIRKLVKISSKGVITIKRWKKVKKGNYKIKVKITAKGNTNFNSKTITKTVKIRIK